MALRSETIRRPRVCMDRGACRHEIAFTPGFNQSTRTFASLQPCNSLWVLSVEVKHCYQPPPNALDLLWPPETDHLVVDHSLCTEWRRWRSCKLGLYSFMPLNDYCPPGLHNHSLCNFELNTIYSSQWLNNKLVVLPDVTRGNNVCWWHSRPRTALHFRCMASGQWARLQLSTVQRAEWTGSWCCLTL